MALDDYYLNAVKRFEGYSPRAAWDYKQHTNGYGTRARSPGEVIDRDEAERRFADEMGKAASLVDARYPNLAPGTRAALTSLTFNAGSGWMNSGLGRAVDAGDRDAIRAHFVQYNKAGGEVLPGLVDRRGAEARWIGAAPPEAGPTAAQQQFANAKPYDPAGNALLGDSPVNLAVASSMAAPATVANGQKSSGNALLAANPTSPATMTTPTPTAATGDDRLNRMQDQLDQLTQQKQGLTNTPLQLAAMPQSNGNALLTEQSAQRPYSNPWG